MRDSAEGKLREHAHASTGEQLKQLSPPPKAAVQLASFVGTQHKSQTVRLLRSPSLLTSSAVAEASHNELLAGIMLALSRVIYTATDNEAFVDAEVRRTTIAAHARVTEAIEAGDTEAALRRMTRHLHTYTEAISAVEDRTAIEVPAD